MDRITNHDEFNTLDWSEYVYKALCYKMWRAVFLFIGVTKI